MYQKQKDTKWNKFVSVVTVLASLLSIIALVSAFATDWGTKVSANSPVVEVDDNTNTDKEELPQGFVGLKSSVVVDSIDINSDMPMVITQLGYSLGLEEGKAYKVNYTYNQKQQSIVLRAYKDSDAGLGDDGVGSVVLQQEKGQDFSFYASNNDMFIWIVDKIVYGAEEIEYNENEAMIMIGADANPQVPFSVDNIELIEPLASYIYENYNLDELEVLLDDSIDVITGDILRLWYRDGDVIKYVDTTVTEVDGSQTGLSYPLYLANYNVAHYDSEGSSGFDINVYLYANVGFTEETGFVTGASLNVVGSGMLSAQPTSVDFDFYCFEKIN